MQVDLLRVFLCDSATRYLWEYRLWWQLPLFIGRVFLCLSAIITLLVLYKGIRDYLQRRKNEL